MLNEHAIQVHGGTSHHVSPDDFIMEVVKAKQSNIGRQILEGIEISDGIKQRDIKIRERRTEYVLNRATQWHQPGIIKLKPKKNNYE